MFRHFNQGFTLFELIVVVAIIGILAAVGYPSYVNYLVRNSEAGSESALQNVANQAKKWRSQRLTYSGFYPLECGSSACSEFGEPNGCTLGVDCKYKITLKDLSDSSKNLTDSSAVGSGFIALAQPDSSWGNGDKANQYILDSVGNRCVAEPGDALTLELSNGCAGVSKNW